MDASKETVSSRHNGTDTHVSSQRPWQHGEVGSIQTRSQYWKGEMDMGLISNQEAACNWYSLTKGKLGFSSGVSLGLSTILQARSYIQKQTTNTEQSRCYFCRHLSHLTLFDHCSLLVFCLFIFISIIVFLWGYFLCVYCLVVLKKREKLTE